MLPQEAHVDATLHRGAEPAAWPFARAPARLEELERTLRRLEHDGRVTEPEYESLQHEFAVTDGYSLDQRVRGRALRAGLRSRAVGSAAHEPLRRRADPRRAGPAAALRPGAAAARRADEPPRPGRAGVARGTPRPPPRQPARGLARPRLPRRHGDARLGAARPAADAVPRQLLSLRPPARGARHPGGRGGRGSGRVRSPARQELIQLYRHQRKHGKMHEHEARLEALRAAREAPRRRPAPAADRGPGRRRARSLVRVGGPSGGPRRRLSSGPGVADAAAAAERDRSP